MNKDWNSIMFDDIGVKIQKVAKAIAQTDIVLSIISGVVLFFCAFIAIDDLWYLIFLAPIAVVVGCIMAWLSVITYSKPIEKQNCSAVHKKVYKCGGEIHKAHGIAAGRA